MKWDEMMVRRAEKARERVGELRWSVRIARKNYEQFGGVPGPSELLDKLGDQDFGEKRPVLVVKSSPRTIREAEKTAEIHKWEAETRLLRVSNQ